ncbi:MAG: hypothetical protein KQH63_04590 [Desulfobulbaceae bacterium]|nr:hypothetical protein [Desulfobulbaceae bacterium]
MGRTNDLEPWDAYPQFKYSVLTATPEQINHLTDDIYLSCGDRKIVLLGDSHDRPICKTVFVSLVEKALRNGETVFACLEIPEENQDDLDKLLGGKRPDKERIASPIIDTPEYREMIRFLGELKTKYPLSVHGIDTDDENAKRDPAMYRNIHQASQTGRYDKIFVFVGSTHAIKEIKWHQDVIGKSQYLGGLLRENDHGTCNIVQHFENDPQEPQLISTATGAGADAAMQVIRFVNHAEQMTGKDVADFVIVW